MCNELLADKLRDDLRWQEKTHRNVCSISLTPAEARELLSLLE